MTTSTQQQASATRLRLFDWAPSPFCMKVRTILAYKGLPYERIRVLGPSLMELVRRSSVRKVPALDIDGRMVIDSTDIACEIERLFPQPAILPADPEMAALSHVLEDWADEALYFLGLYFQWVEPRGKPMVRQAFGGSPLGIVARMFYQRRIEAQLRGQGTGRKFVAHIAADLRREFGAIAAMLAQRPFLLGEQPYLCDFAVNAQLAYMARPPGSAEILADFGVLGDYMERMKALRSTAPSAKATCVDAGSAASESTADREFVHSRLIDAPRERVFRAFAEGQHLANWWGPNGFSSTFEVFEFRPGGAWRLVMHGPDGTDYPNESVFREIDEPQRVVIEHMGETHHFFLFVSLDAQGDQTLVGWRQVFDTAAHRDRIAPFVVGANEQNLDRLSAEVQNIQ